MNAAYRRIGSRVIRGAAAATCLAVGGCASLAAESPGPAPARLAPYRQGIDWAAAGQEASQVLSGYLQVDTSNPPGNELAGARYLAGILSREGIESELIEHRPNRVSMIARLRGKGLEAPLCLLSHIDVVPADAKDWPAATGPFSGAIDGDGMIWGRGALDMKGMGAIELMTMVMLKRRGVPLRRDVILVAVADEEVDNFGARELVEKHWDKLGCSHLVNEGGFGIRDLFIEGQTVFAVSVAEKGLLWLRMTAKGEAGHGSTPLPGRAPDRLIRALANLSAREDDPYIVPSLYQMLAEAGEQAGGLEGFVLKRPALVDLLVLDRLLANPPARAAITNTVSVTGFSGERSVNVVSPKVSALIDCRLLPGTSPAYMLQELRGIVHDPEIQLEVLHAEPSTENGWDDPFYRALVRHTLDGKTNAVAGPVLSPGFTDSMYFRKRGVKAFGLVPFEVTKELAATMHGRNERVSVANVRDGLRALYNAVVDVSAE